VRACRDDSEDEARRDYSVHPFPLRFGGGCGRVGSGRPLWGSPVTRPANRACGLSPHTALVYALPEKLFVGKRASMKLMMASATENQCFPAAGCHHALPKDLSGCYLFQLSDMVYLKRSFHRFTVFTLFSVQSSDDLRATKRPDVPIGFII